MAPSIDRIVTLLDRERRLLHRRDLLAQLQDARLPVPRRVEPRKRGREGRILPSARDPGRIVDQPQRAQCFDQLQFVRIEFGEVLVTGQQVRQLLLHILAAARQQHP